VPQSRPRSRQPTLAVSDNSAPDWISEDLDFYRQNSVLDNTSGSIFEDVDSDHELSESIPDNAIEFGFAELPDLHSEIFSQLSADPELAKLTSQPELPEETLSSQISAEEELDLELLDTDSEDEEFEEFEDVDDHDQPSQSTSAGQSGLPNQRQSRRLQTGRRVYGNLDDDEEQQLIDDIVARPQGTSGVNTLLNAMRQLGVMVDQNARGPEVDKKRIPPLYMHNSRAVRLAVLAGLIDSDGWYVYQENMFGFLQSEPRHGALFWDVVTLARSLGLSVWTKRKMAYTPAKELKPYLCAQIFGNVAEVPCLLARKKALPRLIPQAHNFMIKDIQLEMEETDWFGFRVDKDQLYLRHDFTVIHNSGFEE
jgi:pre-mRNA-processing factor 8